MRTPAPLLLPLLLTLCYCLSGRAAQPQNDKLTDPQIAAKLGISVQQVHSLRAAFKLTAQQFLDLSIAQLSELLRDLAHPGIEKRKAEEEFRVLRMMDEHGKIPPDGLMRALEHRKQVSGDEDLFPVPPDPSTNVLSGDAGAGVAGIQTNSWTWLGPGNIGGRVRSILSHPTLPNVFYCGGADGGVWKTTNSAVSWFPLNDFMPNLAISCMAMDPTDPNTIYAGTGEPTYNGDAIRGAGIFKTVDGGITWFQLPATANSSYLYVSRLSIAPGSGQVILVATRSGIFRTVNGGTNWTQTSSTEMNDLDFHPTDGSQAVASGRAGNVFYSTNAGVTWIAASGVTGSRVEVAYSRSSPNIVYASVDNNGGEIYASTDGGQSYSLRNTGNSFLGNQGWYANALWVDPTNPNVVVVGGLDLWRSTDGGTTLTKISQWFSAPSSAHADHHVIVQTSTYDGNGSRVVLFGNDGGVYRANDVYTVSLISGWQELNNNLGITQFYGGAGNTNSSVIVGGTQDNGDLRYTVGGGTEGWTTWDGGDGGFSAADQSNQSYFYGEYVYLQLHRSANGAASGTDINSGITDAGSGSTANFIAPFILDPNNQATLLAGGASLWRTTNARASTPAWTAIKPSVSSVISAIAVAPGNADVIWVGHNNGSVYSTANGTAASPTWTLRSSGLPGRYCSRIAITPGNPNSVYVTFGGYSSGNVWWTANGGNTWSNITANLPAAPVNSIVIASANTNTLYVGTDVGVFGSSDNGAHWSTGNDGPASVAVDELFWMGPKLVAVTHGRGMFSIVPTIGGAALVAGGAAVSGGNENGFVDPNECLQLSLPIQNIGGAAATNIAAFISTSTPGISISQANSVYPDAAANGVSGNTTPFRFSTTPSFVCGNAVTLNLTVTYSGRTNVLTYLLPSGGSNYTMTASSGAPFVPGVTDTGNHGDDVVESISLPFPVTFYGQVFSMATLDSNGRIAFGSAGPVYQNVCMPSGNPATICAFWDDLRTDASGSGIFISTNGVAPNRVLNIEWRATLYSGGASVNFEIRLYEGLPRFDIVYGTLNESGASATVGLESDSTHFIQYQCNSGALSNGLQLAFQQSCVDGGGQCVPIAAFSGGPLTGPAPLTVTFTNLSTSATDYLWTFGDGTTNSALNPAIIYTNAGLYTVSLTASSTGWSNTFTATNYIVVTNVPPSILSQPQSVAVAPGTNVSFSVTASGTQPLSYQWQRNGTNLAGGTDSLLLLTNISLVDGGNYSVIVTNAGGTVASAPAILSIISVPGFISVGGSPYLESFDEMGPSGTNTPYGWYVGSGVGTLSPGTLFIGNGASVLTRNYNLGSSGSYDRALGSIAGSGLQRDSEARFVNVSGKLITALNINYTGEQWRCGGSTAVTNTLSLLFSLDGASFTNLGSQFAFKSPTLIPSAIALDGNNPTNRVTGIGGIFSPSTPLTNGQPFYLRWVDPDDTGNDMAMALDELVVTFTLADVITNTPPPPVLASFTAAPTNGIAPLTVYFTNLSTAATNYVWTFGDGNVSSLTEPVNVYANPGSYSVTLLASGPGGTNTLTLTNLIQISAPPLLAVASLPLDFGLLQPGDVAQAILVVSNAGGSVLTGAATIAKGAFSLLSESSFDLAPAAATNFTIGFAPSNSGVFSNELTITSDGGNSTNLVTGRAIAHPALDFAPSAATDFDFSFETLPGFEYVVEYKDALTDFLWLPLQTNSGDGYPVTITNSVSEPSQRFYRLRVD